MAEGTVRFFNGERNFGFIASDDGNDVFVHITAFGDEAARPQAGQRVQFETEQSDKGPRATKATLLDEFREVPPSSRGGGGGGRRSGGGGGGGGGGGYRGGSGGGGRREERPRRFSPRDFR